MTPPDWVNAVCLPPARTEAQRVKNATAFVKNLSVRIPILLDDMRDSVSMEYDSQPDRLFVVGPDGTFVYVGGLGPAGVRPSELAPVLKRLSGQSSETASSVAL